MESHNRLQVTLWTFTKSCCAPLGGFSYRSSNWRGLLCPGEYTHTVLLSHSLSHVGYMWNFALCFRSYQQKTAWKGYLLSRRRGVLTTRGSESALVLLSALLLFHSFQHINGWNCIHQHFNLWGRRGAVFHSSTADLIMAAVLASERQLKVKLSKLTSAYTVNYNMNQTVAAVWSNAGRKPLQYQSQSYWNFHTVLWILHTNGVSAGSFILILYFTTILEMSTWSHFTQINVEHAEFWIWDCV